MKKKSFKLGVIMLFCISLFVSGCSVKRSIVKSYSSPSLNTTRIATASVLSLRNSFTQKDASMMLTGDLIQINSMVQAEFKKKNPSVVIIDAVSSNEILNKDSLVNDYDRLLSIYDNTGIPNTQLLNKIGKHMNADVIIQGFVRELYQRDREGFGYGTIPAQTKVVMKYVMFSTHTGDVLWEVNCEGSKTVNKRTAPPLWEVIELIQKKLINSLPTLSK